MRHGRQRVRAGQPGNEEEGRGSAARRIRPARRLRLRVVHRDGGRGERAARAGRAGGLGGELGVLVEKLDAKCPEAIDKSTSDDEIEINIDAIDPRTFHDLDRYVRQCLAQSNPKKKKQAGAGGPAPKKAKA